LIWDQVTAQIRFHAQKLNVTVELIQFTDNSQSLNDQGGIQILFKENSNELVKVYESNLQIGYLFIEINIKKS